MRVEGGQRDRRIQTRHIGVLGGRFGRQQRECGTDLQSESSKENRNEEYTKQLRRETRG